MLTDALNSLSEEALSEKRSPLAPLAIYKREVENARRLLLRQCSEFPAPLDAISINHYESRTASAQGGLLLCEYAPWIVADLVGLRDRSAIERIALPWLMMYAFVVFVDDVIDQPSVPEQKRLLLAAGLLLERATTAIHDLEARMRMPALPLKDSLHTMARMAALDIEAMSQPRYEHTDGSLAALGDRVAGLDICAVYFTDCIGSPPDLDRIRCLTRPLVAGLQMLDDITDWEADLCNGRYSFPLAIASKWSREQRTALKDLAELPSDHILVALVLSKGLENSLCCAASFLSRALANKFANSHSPTEDALGRLILEIERISGRVSNMRERWEGHYLVDQSSGTLSNLNLTPSISADIARLRLDMKIVAQSS